MILRASGEVSTQNRKASKNIQMGDISRFDGPYDPGSVNAPHDISDPNLMSKVAQDNVYLGKHGM